MKFDTTKLHDIDKFLNEVRNLNFKDIRNKISKKSNQIFKVDADVIIAIDKLAKSIKNPKLSKLVDTEFDKFEKKTKKIVDELTDQYERMLGITINALEVDDK